MPEATTWLLEYAYQGPGSDRLVSVTLVMAVVGAVLVAFTVLVLVRKGVPDDASPRLAVIPLVGVAFLAGGFAIHRSLLTEHRELGELSEAGVCVQLEGPVQVLRTQPENGHAPGDLVEIDGVRLVVDYYEAEPGYRKTVSHGGALQEGRLARVEVCGTRIVRVELAQPGPQATTR